MWGGGQAFCKTVHKLLPLKVDGLNSPVRKGRFAVCLSFFLLLLFSEATFFFSFSLSSGLFFEEVIVLTFPLLKDLQRVVTSPIKQC